MTSSEPVSFSEQLSSMEYGVIYLCTGNRVERVGGRYEKMKGHCSTGQSSQWAVVPMEEEEEEEELAIETTL